MKKNILLLLIFVSQHVYNQTELIEKIDLKTTDQIAIKNNKLFIFWGWNRAFYTPSDIHFKGADYDFILHNVVAHDRQTPFGFDPYFHPLRVTVPQTNFRAGYSVKDDLTVLFFIDHMKYVMDQNQTVNFSGTIGDSIYASKIINQKVDLADGQFLTFEHTDGLNYVGFSVEKYQKIYANKWFNLNWSMGVGAGILLPKSNVKLFENERSDRFHFAGFGLDLHPNLNFILWNHLLFRIEGKAGYINMPSIMTTLQNAPDIASQHFAFMQWNIGVGYIFNQYCPK